MANIQFQDWGSNTAAKESVRVDFDYFKGNLNRISITAKFAEHEYHIHAIELNNTGPSNRISLAALIAFCSILMNKPVQEQMVILGDMTLGGVINSVEDLAGCLQLALESGVKRIVADVVSVGYSHGTGRDIFNVSD
jgi:ATP-dependent Lon protease